MKQYFWFEPYSYDFWPLYDAIKIYYPVGIRFSQPYLYHEYEGQKKLGALIVDNFHNQENFQERCVDFTDQLQLQFGLEVQGTTYGQQPAFSFDLILENTEMQGLIKVKKLSAAISLLGDFYAIYGIDETIMVDEGKPYPKQYHAINALTVSPFKEFELPFLALKKAIQDRYPLHKQVPFNVLTMYLEGLYNKYDETNESMIYNALFDQKLSHNYYHQQRGDSSYGREEWLKEGVDLSEMKSIEVIVMPPPPPSGIGN